LQQQDEEEGGEYEIFSYEVRGKLVDEVSYL